MPSHSRRYCDGGTVNIAKVESTSELRRKETLARMFSPEEPGIYVEPLTSPGLRRQIANGGAFAVWHKDGKEIIYEQQRRIWSVRVDGVGTQLRFATPEPLFPVAMPLGMLSGGRPLDVSRDGSKIYFLESAEEPDSGVIHVRTHAIR